MINFPENVPSQIERHFCHIAAALTIGGVGFWAKPKIERAIRNENATNQEKEKFESKIAAYFGTACLGAILGGILKGLRTRTVGGTMAGVITGAIVSLVGAGLSEFRSASNASPPPRLGQ